MSGTLVAVEAGTPVRVCTVSVPDFCGQTAVKALDVRLYPRDDWERHYRCAGHPAEDWLPIIRRVHPMAETRIEAIA